MIFEIAHIQIKSATHAAFEAAVTKAVPLFQRARGCESMRLERSIENGDAYRLVVGWTTLEDHTVHFRGSEDFQAWRGLVGEFFAAPPQVEHMDTVVTGF
ncbi:MULTISPECIES: antibiotic biosynthesis monooxygenase [Janthinobacterium]|uniref:Antibiotic biosynthesis monooxygenase n=1 Tax=Janthinobacterium rivuli TaxID=2751478 RepID=A0ABY8I7X0_9BURK|nr:MULTISPECIES: antibiotic biosynthesis monooxygenase family protein [Janthinobacterium]PHV34693.1 antibiotic biosynthesis monooxygenase [Janthinobacterium sp. BJB312]MBW3512962.1 antibiotic biosynthesis monooxygenase [Janthinobacterium sp. NKUCC06_STL]MCA1862977.1 antibiotic biosynthesis monooxygenase [Janthinobacterium lividum]NVI84832.1 antibiotic biosynthesis monooxygenase [Janthinobacterium sp. BJB401]WFR81025.1 antibiotic biosynthesis monooxygenase [Janthinobacterium rivuli]